MNGFEIPMLLLASFDDAGLHFFLKKVKRMRRRFVEFGLNGAIHLVKRKDAVMLAESEVKARQASSEAARQG